VDILEEDNKENTEENKQPEIDLIDKEGHKEKLEVYEEKKEPVKEETIQPEEKPIEEIKEEKPEEKPEVKEEQEVEEEKLEEKQEIKEEAKVEEKKEEPRVEKEEEIPKEPKEKFSKRILNFYDKKYKKLMFIPIIMFILAIVVIGVQTARTGSFIHKDVSLKGGVTLTITKEGAIDITALETNLESQFTNNDISVRSINKGGTQIGVVIVADIEGTDKEELDSFISSIESNVGFELKEEDYSIEVMGSSLGASFFKETFIALIFAFILMSLVVLIYFRSVIPSLGVILAAFSDIIVTLAIVDLMGMKLSTGGIAAFLMLIGYSVDTNVLLNTRVLKRKEGLVFDRVIGAVKTGMMMTLTTIGALIVGIIFVQSAIIKQIMIIVLIGLCVDIINTWIQNVGILRYYIERKNKNVLKKS
jgi:preprotein translocase subunit SecF